MFVTSSLFSVLIKSLTLIVFIWGTRFVECLYVEPLPFEVDKELMGKKFRTLSNIGPQMCVKECAYVGNCKSVNYLKQRLTCVLNSEDHSNVTLEHTPGTDYIALMDVIDLQIRVGECSSNPCSFYSRCVPTFSHTVCALHCPAGTHRMNSSTCSPCMPDSYSTRSNTKTCSVCPNDWKQPEYGKSECIESCFRNPYQGNKSITEENIPCQRWDSDIPHISLYKSKPDAVANHCRTYDNSLPWCYTTNPAIRWQNCGLSPC